MKIFKKVVITSVITGLIFIFLLNANTIFLTTKSSISYCFEVLIPSIFGFLVLSDLFISTNSYSFLGQLFSIISRVLFKISPPFFSVFILSSLGGYPIGIKSLLTLYKNNKIEKKTAEKMLCYCYCIAPSFAISVIGIFLYQNAKVGLISYFSIVISNITIGILIGIKNKTPEKSKKKIEVNFTFSNLDKSIISASKTVFMICSTMIFFNCLIEIFNIKTLFSKNISAFLTAFIEINSLTLLEQKNYNLIPIITAVTAFGGLCVLLQIYSINKNNLSLKLFFATRPLQIFLAFIYSIVLSKIFLTKEILPTNTRFFFSKNDKSFFSIFCVIIMTFYLLKKIYLALTFLKKNVKIE